MDAGTGSLALSRSRHSRRAVMKLGFASATAAVMPALFAPRAARAQSHDVRVGFQKGAPNLLVLKALSWTPMHGFEITSWLEERSGGVLEVADSALYQALIRMEERGLVDADWGVTENNRRARYYHLTERGRTHLAEESERLLRYAHTLRVILGATPAPQRAR